MLGCHRGNTSQSKISELLIRRVLFHILEYITTTHKRTPAFPVFPPLKPLAYLRIRFGGKVTGEIQQERFCIVQHGIGVC